MPRILFVDDDLIYLSILSEQLRDMRHEVVVASTVQDAIILLDCEQFDIVICDTIMAGGGALTLLYEVRGRDPDFPFIVITGQREIASSPLFRDGMRQASAKIEKTTSLLDIDKLIRSLLT